MRLAAAVFLAGLAAGCSVPSKPGTPITLAGTLQDSKAPSRVTTASLLMLQPAGSGPPAAPVKLTCDAASLFYLIGRPRTEIPVPADLSRRRVACSTCVTPSDRQPTRTDIIFDANTNRVTTVTCG